MTKEDKDKIDKQLMQIKNVSVLLTSMFKPVEQHMRDTHCSQDVAIDRIDKAYNFLKKYGVNYLETAERQIKEIVNEEYKDINNIVLIGKKL